MVSLEQMRLPDSLDSLRAAVKSDPNFAQAFILISDLTDDPAERSAARLQAKRLAQKASAGERLLIVWLAGVQEDNYVLAIAAMNDLLAKYSHDQRLAFLAGRWLIQQQRYAQAEVLLERATDSAPGYAAAWNELGYAYALSGDFPKAFSAMQRYVGLEPDQPNPHDSYGEILCMAGKFDAAIEQYRTSIRIDPSFGSELGIADAYALMGKEDDARQEYARAMLFAGSESAKVAYQLQAAMTWIRENNRKAAEKALEETAKHAHQAGLAPLEAESYRFLAMSDPDSKAALKHLQVAQDALQHHPELAGRDRDEELARILRVRAAHLAGDQSFDSATTVVQQLETMAQTSRSQVVQRSYHAAAGAVLVAQRKYADAIPQLEEDSDDPLSMQLLLQAYEGTGAVLQADSLASKLAALNVPTIEQALVVPAFRAGLVSQARR